MVLPRRMWWLAVGAAFLCLAQVTFAETPPAPKPTRLPTPLPGGEMLPAWMTPPAGGPSQAERGAVVYYYRCMACHGDRGQGLTVEWRAQWDVEHQDCSRGPCHGGRAPPEGFRLPKNFAPAILGANTLTRFENAGALYAFVSARMPYQAPGSLSRDEYWQLVAFLVNRHGVQVDALDAVNAARVPVNPPAQPPELVWWLGALGVVAAVAGAVWRGRLRG